MSREEKATARPGRLEALLTAGDHLAAAREARAVLGDPGASADQRAQAGAALASLSPEPFALALAAAGVLLAVGLSLWLAAGGAR